MKKISSIAIDDEPKALDVIRFHAAKLEELELLACFSDAKEALTYLKSNPVDLIFLDINMPVLTGFDLIERLRMKYHIIFTTAYSEYAVRSYEVEAVDYLLKPFEFDRFWQAFNKVKSLVSSVKSADNSPETENYIFIGDGYKKIRLDFSQILYVEGSGNYVTIHTKTQKVLSRMRIYEIQQKLPFESFFRIHNSYIINLEKIDKIENNQAYINEIQLSISSKYREAFFKRIDL